MDDEDDGGDSPGIPSPQSHSHIQKAQELTPEPPQKAPENLSVSAKCNIKDRPTGGGTHPSAIPTAYRPGRLSHIEILERIFPTQKRTVLELVLQGCNGDLVKAIEHFLSAQDSLAVQQQLTPPSERHSGGGKEPKERINSSHPYMAGLSAFSRTAAGLNGMSKMPPGLGGGVKSAFTPLSPSTYPGLHSAFSPRAAAFTTDALLGRHPMLPTHARPGDTILPHPAGFPYPGLAPIPTSLPTGFGPPLFMTPYRPFGVDQLSPSHKLLEKAHDRSVLTDSEHTSDSWEDSPSKDKADID